MSKNMFKIMGANSHAVDKERQAEDFYATDPKAIDHLFKVEEFSHLIWEPATGMGHLAEAIKAHKRSVYCTDIIDRGYPCKISNFLKTDDIFHGDIITNPPFKLAKEFIIKAHQVTCQGAKIAMFLKLQYLETQGRADLFQQFPMRRIWISRKRIICAKNGEFEKIKSSAVAYAWYIWENGYTGKTELGWIN